MEGCGLVGEDEEQQQCPSAHDDDVSAVRGPSERAWSCGVVWWCGPCGVVRAIRRPLLEQCLPPIRVDASLPPLTARQRTAAALHRRASDLHSSGTCTLGARAMT